MYFADSFFHRKKLNIEENAWKKHLLLGYSGLDFFICGTSPDQVNSKMNSLVDDRWLIYFQGFSLPYKHISSSIKTSFKNFCAFKNSRSLKMPLVFYIIKCFADSATTVQKNRFHPKKIDLKALKGNQKPKKLSVQWSLPILHCREVEFISN